MKSPFPGLDPFIEACGRWEGFHAKLIGDMEQSLARTLPDRYLVDIGERYYVVISAGDEEKEHSAGADVGVLGSRAVWTPSDATGSTSTQTVVAATDTPVTMRAFVEASFRETFVEIRHLSDQRLVTVIEVLSPTNKRYGSEGWKLYARKRQACLTDEDINLVELDLIRGGQRHPMLDPWPDSPYYLLVKRQGAGGSCKVWPAHSMRPLPNLPVPLSRPDPDVVLQLQPLIDSIFERSRYGRFLDYRKACVPPLGPNEAELLSGRR